MSKKNKSEVSLFRFNFHIIQPGPVVLKKTYVTAKSLSLAIKKLKNYYKGKNLNIHIKTYNEFLPVFSKSVEV